MKDTEKQVIIRDLGAKLKALTATAEQLRNVGDQVNGWKPTLGKCHENVDSWIAAHHGDRAARGWILTQYLAPFGFDRFTSHSVIQTPTGELLDVTLPLHECHHRFVRHPGSDAEFLGLVANNGCPWIDIPLDGPDPRLDEYQSLGILR